MPPALRCLALTLAFSLPAAAATRIDVANTLQALQTAIGAASCETNDDCHVIGVGARACGGPESYLPWSSRDGDEATIKSLAEQHHTARQAEVTARGEMSTCSILPKPAVRCQAKRCELQPRVTSTGKDDI
ncbi:hypothetical protein [Chitinimonas sp. BJB300]|uniref:hypothetical protein n=1 Tax=Chitinimonas sp. BJB300 TaxID=1559339 RepID=UPI000C0F1F6C|nr:hypothetical protein [Chitinimonas sp. BJB300]PHV11806.1 hypothetical protein CSQ89_08880 [Chitinimonas sp. BJB300]TSJ87020.1 hypothetical protein FG002_015695 [Chitinimonas sp. BJB300]